VDRKENGNQATATAAEALDSSVQYFARLADGGGLITQVMLSNPGVSDVTAMLEAFNTGTGTPLTVTFSGLTSSSFTWKIKSPVSQFLKSAGAGAQPETGWIRVQAMGKLGGDLCPTPADNSDTGTAVHVDCVIGE
jgi:hypothetical protein